MAETFYEPGTQKSPVIPYPSLGHLLFPIEPKQKLIPLLGAGSSLSGRGCKAKSISTFQPQKNIEGILDAGGFKTRRARLFMILAAGMAGAIQAEEETANKVKQKPFETVMHSHFPPTSNDLSDVLADLSSYDPFERSRTKLRDLLLKANLETPRTPI